MSETIAVSPISAVDWSDVSTFLCGAAWRYEHFDFEKEEAFQGPGFLARDHVGQMLGVLGCRLDRPPVATLVYVAIGASVLPSTVVPAMLAPAEEELRSAGAAQLCFVGSASWLSRALAVAGFEIRTTIISYEYWGAVFPKPTQVNVHTRPAKEIDAAELHRLDMLAFEPMWRYPVDMHRRFIRNAARVVVGEIYDTIVSYLTCDIRHGQAQIIRLVVHPAWQGKGIGSALLAEALEHFRLQGVRSVMINTQADNVAARHLYESFGFRRIGEEVPAMVKDLVPGAGAGMSLS